MREIVECEECYVLYIGVIEGVFHPISTYVGECYFWLARFYYEINAYKKSEACYLKVISIEREVG